MTEIRPPSISYIRAFRPVVPSESLIAFRKHADRLLGEMVFSNSNPLVESDVYKLKTLRVTLFERRTQDKQSIDSLNKLHAVLAEEKITTTKRVLARPGVRQPITRRVPNPILKALSEVEETYLADHTDSDDRYTFNLRSASIIDSTEDDYRDGGTELALLLEHNDGVDALMAQHGIYEDMAKGMNAARRLNKPQWHEKLGGLVVPFMVAPFDTDGDRDDFIDSLMTHEPPVLPVHGIEVGDIKWQLKT